MIESKTTTSPLSEMRGDVLRMPTGHTDAPGGFDTTSAADGTVGSAWLGSLMAANVPMIAMAATMAPQRVHPAGFEEGAPSG